MAWISDNLTVLCVDLDRRSDHADAAQGFATPHPHYAEHRPFSVGIAYRSNVHVVRDPQTRNGACLS